TFQDCGALSGMGQNCINQLVTTGARMIAITLNTAAARMIRRTGKRISQSTENELESGFGEFQLLEGNTVSDHGGIDRVNAWCREAGVLAHGEVVSGG
ncbi:hypothetical protein QUU09_22520, partial [Xanthomonas citri pv. citri]